MKTVPELFKIIRINNEEIAEVLGITKQRAGDLSSGRYKPTEEEHRKLINLAQGVKELKAGQNGH